MTVHFRHIDSPIGLLFIAADDTGLRAVEFPENRHPVKREGDWHEGDHPLLDEAERQLGEYFAGKRRDFDLPLAPRGTDFQLGVWQALRSIPFGETWSYAQLAASSWLAACPQQPRRAASTSAWC